MSKSCDDVRKELSLYIDGELSLKEMNEVCEHVSSCKVCSDAYAFLSGVVKATGEMPMVAASEGFHKALHDKLVLAEAEKKTINVPKKRPMWQAFSGMAAAAAVIVLSVVAFGQLPKMGSLPKQDTLSSEPTPRMTQTTPTEAPSFANEKEGQQPVGIQHRGLTTTPEPTQNPVNDAQNFSAKGGTSELAEENGETQSVGLSLADVPADETEAMVTTIHYTLKESAYSRAISILADYEQREAVYYIPQNEAAAVCESIVALSGYVNHTVESASEQMTTDFVQIVISLAE